MKRIMFALLGLGMWLLLAQPSVIVADEVQQAPSCLFFTETASEGGFSVCDDSEARFRSAFEQWGLENIGYPISRRYVYDGFVTQVFQKALMQWRADGEYVALINMFDDLHNAGFDESLFAFYQTPYQLPAGWDGDIGFSEVIKKRQALLMEREALHQFYFASDDPLLLYGLPTSDVQDMGNHYAIRLQRTVLQEWKEDVPWARAGQVTVANGPDIAKKLNFLPAEPLMPENAPSSERRKLDLFFYRGTTLDYAPATWQTSPLNEPFAALEHNTIDECIILEQGPTEIRGDFESKNLGQITYHVYPEYNPGLNRPSSDINKFYLARSTFNVAFIVSGPEEQWAQCEADVEAVLATLSRSRRPSSSTGIIAGHFYGPAPAMSIYAFSLDKELYYETNSEEGAQSYEIEVPPGTYEVIGYQDEDRSLWNKKSPMGYWEATRCYFEPDCNPEGSFFKLAAVTVGPGERVPYIDMNSNVYRPRSYPLPASALAEQDLPRDPLGAIYGEIPSSSTQNVRVYAQHVDHNGVVYFTDLNMGEKFYRLLLPTGDYKLFAYTLDGDFAGSYTDNTHNNERLAVVTVKAGERLTQMNLQAEGANLPQPKADASAPDSSLTELRLPGRLFNLSYKASEWQSIEEDQDIYYLKHQTMAECRLIYEMPSAQLGGHLLKTMAGPITFDMYLDHGFRVNTDSTRAVAYHSRSGFASHDQADLYPIHSPLLIIEAPVNKWQSCQAAAYPVLATLGVDELFRSKRQTVEVELSMYPFTLLDDGPMWQTEQENSGPFLRHRRMRECSFYEEMPRSLPSGDFRTRTLGHITADVYRVFDDPQLPLIQNLYVPRSGFDNPTGSQPLFIIKGSTYNWPDCRAEAEKLLSTLNSKQ